MLDDFPDSDILLFSFLAFSNRPVILSFVKASLILLVHRWLPRKDQRSGSGWQNDIEEPH